MLAKFIFKQLGVNFEDRMDYYDFPIDEREDGKSYNSWNVKRFDKSKYSSKPTVFYSLDFLKAISDHLTFLYNRQFEDQGVSVTGDLMVKTEKVLIDNDWFTYRYEDGNFMIYANDVENNPYKDLNLKFTVNDYAYLGRIINSLENKASYIDEDVIASVSSSKIGRVRINKARVTISQQEPLIKDQATYNIYFDSIVEPLRLIYKYCYKTIQMMNKIQKH